MKTLVLTILVCSIAQTFAQNGGQTDPDDEALLSIIEDLSHKIDAIEKELEQQQLDHEKAIVRQKKKNAEEIDRVHEKYGKKLSKLQQIATAVSEPEMYYTSSAACLLEPLNMQCPPGKVIYLTTGYYGQYAYTCDDSDGCCAPHPVDDCQELMSDDARQDWLALKAVCDGLQSCSVINQGNVVISCTDPYVSDYAIVYYTCTPEEELDNRTIGFTAIANESRLYAAGENIRFDFTTTNVGNHFVADTSIFICPVSGMYAFFASAASVNGYNMKVDIMYENVMLITTVADQADINQGAAMVVINCEPDQRVWLRSAEANNYLTGGSSIKVSTFTGFLIFAN